MKNILLLFVLLAFSAGLSAQGNIGINDQNPDPLAILDIESTSKGVLIPRMTEGERAAIAVTAAQNGLLVYQTDGNAGFWFFNGTSWGKLGESSGRIVDYAMGSSFGNSPINGLNFLSPTAVVSITAPGQKIIVTSHKALGSTVVGGASELNIWIGYRISGGAGDPSTVGSGMYGLRVAQNTRVTMGINGIIEGLPVGDYEVGMVGNGFAGFANWNNNEYGYTTALVVD